MYIFMYGFVLFMKTLFRVPLAVWYYLSNNFQRTITFINIICSFWFLKIRTDIYAQLLDFVHYWEKEYTIE